MTEKIIFFVFCLHGFTLFAQKNDVDEHRKEIDLFIENQNLGYQVYQYKNFEVVQIGNQLWMLENLNTDVFKNGDTILHAQTKIQWEMANEKGIPAWCYYNEDSNYGKTYGKLYNWYAVNDPRGLAPDGCRVAKFADFEELNDYLGNSSGLKMKMKYFWKGFGCMECKGLGDNDSKKCKACKGKPENSLKLFSGNGNNFSGFSGLPGGSRFSTGEFDAWSDEIQLGRYGFWWCLNEQNDKLAKYVKLQNKSNTLDIYGAKEKGTGMSVRCLLK